MTVLFEAPDFSIAHDEANSWLYIRWVGTHPGLSSLARCNLILEKAKQTRCSKILNDSGRDLDSWSEVIQWLTYDFFRQLCLAGVGVVAWVLPHNLRARADTNQVVTRLSQLKTALPLVDTFADVEAAYAWLQKTEVDSQQAMQSLTSEVAVPQAKA